MRPPLKGRTERQTEPWLACLAVLDLSGCQLPYDPEESGRDGCLLPGPQLALLDEVAEGQDGGTRTGDTAEVTQEAACSLLVLAKLGSG